MMIGHQRVKVFEGGQDKRGGPDDAAKVRSFIDSIDKITGNYSARFIVSSTK